MDDKDWGLTAKGFKCPTYVELLNAYEYKAPGTVWDKSKPDSSIAAGNFPPHLRMDYIAAFSTYGRCLQ